MCSATTTITVDCRRRRLHHLPVGRLYSLAMTASKNWRGGMLRHGVLGTVSLHWGADAHRPSCICRDRGLQLHLECMTHHLGAEDTDRTCLLRKHDGG